METIVIISSFYCKSSLLKCTTIRFHKVIYLKRFHKFLGSPNHHARHGILNYVGIRRTLGENIGGILIILGVPVDLRLLGRLNDIFYEVGANCLPIYLATALEFERKLPLYMYVNIVRNRNEPEN